MLTHKFFFTHSVKEIILIFMGDIAESTILHFKIEKKKDQKLTFFSYEAQDKSGIIRRSGCGYEFHADSRE